MSAKSSSRLQEVLAGGGFAVTSECGPPRGADPDVIRKKGELLKGWVDAVNVTDNGMFPDNGDASILSIAGAKLTLPT